MASGGGFRYSEQTPFSLQNSKNLTLDMKNEVFVKDGGAQIAIYPNPADDIVVIKSDGQFISSYEIHDVFGKLIEKGSNGIKTPNTTIYLDVKKYLSGMYFVTIYDDKQQKEVNQLIVK